MKKSIGLGLVVSLLILMVAGCGPQNQDKPVGSQDPIVVSIAGLRGPTSVGMVKMFEELPSLGKNVTTQYEVVETPDILVSKVLNKEVDFAALPVNVAANLYNKGVGYQLLAINTWGNLYVVSKGDGIKGWDDLYGKVIYSIGRGATPDMVFRVVLQQQGIDPERDVTINYSLSQVELANALIAGKIDLAVLPEPFVTMVTMRNNNLHIPMNLEEEWKKVKGEDASIPQGCMIVRKEFAENHSSIIELFLEEYQDSIGWVNHNLKEAGELVEKHNIGMQAPIAEKAIPRSNIKFMAAGDARKSVEAFLSIFIDNSPEAVGGRLPDENFYYQR